MRCWLDLMGSLITNVPADKVVCVIHNKLKEDGMLKEDRTIPSLESVAELLKLCQRSTYFS